MSVQDYDSDEFEKGEKRMDTAQHIPQGQGQQNILAFYADDQKVEDIEDLDAQEKEEVMELSGAKKAGKDPNRAVGRMMGEQEPASQGFTNQTVGPTQALQDLTGFQQQQPAYIEQPNVNAFHFQEQEQL